MGSKIPTYQGTRDPMFKNRLITDLDEVSDERKLDETIESKKKPPIKPKRDNKLKGRGVNGLPNRRAKSSDGFRITDKWNVKQLLKIKDEQIEKLVEKLNSVLEFNSQFGRENDRLVNERQQLLTEIETLKQKVDEIQNRECLECRKTQEALTKLQTDYDTCSKENADLSNDVKMMKVLVYRLNIQIERYQDYLRKLKIKDDSIYRIDFDGQTDGEWGPLNSNILAPLLNAYEEMVHEKSDIVRQFEQEMSDFTGKLKRTLEENEQLQKELDGLKRNTDSWIEEKTRFQAQVDLYRNKAEVQGKRADLAKEKLVEVLRVYEQKVQSQVLDIERLQEAYSRSRGELSTLRSFQQKPESVAESLKECQRLFEELKLHHGKEKNKAEERLVELTQKLETQSKELQALKDENRELKATLEKNEEQQKLLDDKYNGLKQNIARIRQSKELLRNRLKAVIDWSKGVEEGKVKVQTTWNELSVLENLLAQKELQIQALLARHRTEVEELRRKLRNREDSLKKILRERTERKSTPEKK